MKTVIVISISASIIAFLAPWRWDLNRFIYDEDPILEMAFPADKAIEAYDPARIRFAHEYILLEGIYSPLIIFSDANGAPYSAVARKFYWKGNELHFIIRQDMKTIDGHPITAEDVLLSVKRLLILSQNTHGDFKSLVCPNAKLKKLSDDCPGMVVEGHTFILRPTMKRFFILDLFASIDFAIIPKGSYDPVTLKITDYRNTSGPHYVAEDRGQGRIILKANPTHIRFEKTMAQEIHLVPTKGLNRRQVVELYNQGKIDHITTIEGAEVEDILKKVDWDETSYHETLPIVLAVARITDKGKKRIPLKRRLAFAKALQKALGDHCMRREGCTPTDQFFLPLMGGELTPSEKKTLQKAMDSVEMETSGEGIFLGIYDSNPSELDNYFKAIKATMPQIRIERAKGSPAFTKLEDRDLPDYVMVFTNAGFLENVSLLSYAIKAKYFGIPIKEGKAWLKTYMDTQDKLKRLELTRQLHLESLIRGRTIPLYRMPYVAIARKPWKLHLPQIFGNNQFWKIRQD